MIPFVNKLYRAIRAHSTQFLLVVLAVIVVMELSVLKYEYEPDPLIVEATSPIQHYKLRAGDEFSFQRWVCSTKDLQVKVHREFYDRANNKKYMIHEVGYVADASQGCYTGEFRATVPKDMPAGIYEYRPVLNYRVNPVLTITKPSPPEIVEIIE